MRRVRRTGRFGWLLVDRLDDPTAFESTAVVVPLPAGDKYWLPKRTCRHDGASAWPIVVGLDEPRGTCCKGRGANDPVDGPVNGPEFSGAKMG
jgi:hypothetical protein